MQVDNMMESIIFKLYEWKKNKEVVIKFILGFWNNIKYNIQSCFSSNMNSAEKIDKQVHTASVLVCSNDPQVSFKSATWLRRYENITKLIKKQFLQGKQNSVYNCTLFDFGSYIDLELESYDGQVKAYEYGPIKLDRKAQEVMESELKNKESFNITLLLNKNQKFEATLSFSNIESEMLNNVVLQIQYMKPGSWYECQQLFENDNHSPQRINIKLGQNKIPFVKSLAKLNIFVHYGNYLNVIFKSVQEKQLFLLDILAMLEFKRKKKMERNQSHRKNSLKLSQINLLFASTDCFSDPMSPCAISENVLQDFRNIVFTPKPEFQRQARQRGFISLESFLGIDDNNNHTMHKRSHKIIQSIKTNQTIKAIKQQQLQEQVQQKNKSPKQNKNTKSHEFIFAWNKNRSSLKINNSKQRYVKHRKTEYISKSKSKDKDKQKQREGSQQQTQRMKEGRKSQKITYEKLLQRILALQQQNKILIQENKCLKQRVNSLQKLKIKEKQLITPQFILDRKHQQKNNETSINQRIRTQRFTESKRSQSRRKKLSMMPNTSKDNRRISDAFGRDSMSNYSPSSFTLSRYNLKNYLQSSKF